ncbi:MAG: TasA family protein [bacterium]|nr:TasA family protein [bacterium]
MNKKILISLSVIGAVAAIVVGGTIAYFSDVETSTGNTFTAGSIDLKIDNHCYLNGDECVCTGDPEEEVCTWQSGPNIGETCTCSWSLKDLTEEEDLFFSFSDLKPGDYGEDTVSMHVYDNNAWVCAAFCNLVSDDETCVEPELEAEPGCGEPGEDGELAENLFLVFWADVCDEYDAVPGDNIYQDECDEVIMVDYADEIIPSQTYTLADPTESVFPPDLLDEEGALIGSHDYYIGKAWCFGAMDGDAFYEGEIVCDGKLVGNEAQTDSLTGDIIFYVEQSRNNPGFSCPDLCASPI